MNLQFSTFLNRAPIVTLGDERLSMVPEGPAESADRWSGSMSAKRLTAGAPATLRVILGSGNKPFGSLDAEPATPAYVGVGDDRWTGYDAGGDENHKIKIGK